MKPDMTVTDEMIESAVIWRLRLGEAPADAELQASFEEWLKRDAAHVEACVMLGTAWRSLAECASSTEIQQMRASARNDGSDSNYGSDSPVAEWPSRLRVLGLVALVALVFSCAGFYLAGPHFVPQDERVLTAGIDAPRSERLADGSRVILDKDSLVRVSYYRSRRELVLERGQARFEVVKNANRPFSVSADDKTVVATGTVFVVSLEPSGFVTTLLRGGVDVSPRNQGFKAMLGLGAPQMSLHLRPGQQLRDVGGRLELLSNVDVAAVTAWQNGRLVFDREPLGQAAAQVNWYSPKAKVTVDPVTRNLPISGVFNTGDADAFVSAVQALHAVQVTRESDGAYRIGSCK